MQEAIADAKLTEEEISHPDVGLVMGTGGASSEHQVLVADTLRAKGVKRLVLCCASYYVEYSQCMLIDIF